MLLLFALTVVFRDVAVIDMEAGKARPGVTVVVAGGRIESAGRGVPIPAGARVLDGRGKFLMPGLWDMHVHMHASLDFDADTAAAGFFAPQFLANGVTGVRCMWDSMNAVRKLRQKIKAPRVVATGAILDGPQPYWPGSRRAARRRRRARRFASSSRRARIS